MKKGEIILIPFPFTDLTGDKSRPGLVLANSRWDVVVAFISTQIQKQEEGDLFVTASTENRLKKDSIIILRKLATVDKARTIGRIGVLEDSYVASLNEKLKKLFQLDSE